MSNEPAGVISNTVLRVLVDITLPSIRMLSVSIMFAFTCVAAKRFKSCVDTIVFPLTLNFKFEEPCSPFKDIKSDVSVLPLMYNGLNVVSELTLI